MAFVMASITQSLMSLKYSPKAITFSYFVSKSQLKRCKGHNTCGVTHRETYFCYAWLTENTLV